MFHSNTYIVLVKADWPHLHNKYCARFSAPNFNCLNVSQQDIAKAFDIVPGKRSHFKAGISTKTDQIS